MASFEIYIKNYKAQNGNIVSVERLMQTIPMTSDPVITNPKVKTDLGKAGSFEFGLEMNSPYYDAMLQMKTILRVVYFGVTIFRGRVLTIDKSFQRSRTVHCEGDLAFLIDSHQIGQKEESRPETDLFTYLTSVIAQHNSDVADAEKRFTLGEVPMNYSRSVLSDQMVNIPADKAIQKYGNSSYDTSMDRLESLLSDFGGYMRTRYDSSNGTTYLDWYDNYYNPYVGQDIEVLSNLIDLSGPTEVENLFTVVLPIGKKDNGEVYINEWWPKVRPDHAKVNYITVPELATVPLYSDTELTSGYHRKEDYTNAISRFGRIWKIVEFENANTPQKLFTYAKDWIKNNFMPELTQWDVSALDMRFIDGQTRAIYTGDRIKLVHPEVDQNYMYITIISAEYDLYNPDKNKFKIGVPDQQLNASYGVKQKSKGAKSFNSGITDLSSLTNDLEQQINGALEAIKRDRDILQQQYILKTTYGHDIGLDDPLAFLVYETDCITEKDPKEISKNTSKIIQTLEWTKKLKFTELVQSAMQKSLETGLPVAWNDLQNVIDNTPDVKQQQVAFKTLATNHLINDLDLPTDEAMDLLNDSSALYEAASMVDDNGNWTQKAIDKGALVWNPALKDVYVHAHEVVNNQGSSIGTGILNHAAGWMTSGSLNVNDYLSLDGLTNQFDLGNIINTQDFTDSLTGVSEKLVSMIGGQFDLSEITNTLTGLKNKAVSALGDLFSGTEIEDTVNNLTNKAVSFVDDLFNGTKIENTLTGVKDKAINFIGGLFSGISKEKDGSADTDKSVNILSGLITGSDQETGSTGEKRSFFDILGGLFTGEETKESSAAEALKTFFLGNDKVEVDGDTGTAQFGDGYDWMVKLNETVGNVGGFVSANDFQAIGEIPSFKTKFAAIGKLYADQAEIVNAYVNKLTAIEAYIDKINANKVTANTLVSASYGRFSTLDVSGTVYLPYQTTYIETSDEQRANVGKALKGCTSTFNNGHWTLNFSCLDGTSGPSPDFNLAESEWFQAQASAKLDTGWDNASAVVSIPKLESTNSRVISVSTPYSRTTGNNTTRGTETNTYTITNLNNNQVCLTWDQGHSGDGTIVAVFPHNQYTLGQQSVTVTSAEILANLVDYSSRPVKGPMEVRLSNMEPSDNPITLTVNLDNVYQAGLDGTDDYTSTADFEFDLTDGSSVWSGYFDDVPVDFVYNKGVEDREPVIVSEYYIYNEYGWTVSLYRGQSSSDYAYSGFLYPQTKVSVVSEDENRYQISYSGVTGWLNKSYVRYEDSPSSPTIHPGKNGWATLSDVGYSYPVKIGTADTKIYRSYGSSTVVQTVGVGTTVIAESDPDTLPSTDQYVGVAYRKADHEIYLGYVDRANIGGADTGFTVTINAIYHCSDDYNAEIPTTMILKDGAQRIIRSQNYSYNGYDGIVVSTGINISDFFTATKTGCYGYYQLAAVTDSEIYQKVNFTVTYSDGSPSKTYTLEFKSYKKTSSTEFVEGQIVYVYASNGGAVNVRKGASSSYGSYGQLVPHTPVTVVSGPTNGYYQITYSQTGYNTVTGYMDSQYLKDSVQGSSNYNYTGWKKDDPVSKEVTGVTVRNIYHIMPAKDFSVFYTPKNGSRERVTSVYDIATYNSISATTSNYTQFFDELPKHYSASYSGAVTHKFVIDASYSDGTTTRNICFVVNSSN